MQCHSSVLLAQPINQQIVKDFTLSLRGRWLQLHNPLGWGCLSELGGFPRCGEAVQLLKSSSSDVCSGRGRGSVWLFTSFIHLLGVLEVPALLVTLPKPWTCFWGVSTMGRAEMWFCAVPAWWQWSSLSSFHTCDGDAIQLGFVVCGEDAYPFNFRNWRYECHSAEASQYFCLHHVCNSLPSGCGCTRLSAVRRWGLLVGLEAWSPATTSLFFSCPCLCAAVTRAERWVGFKLPILRSEFLNVCFWLG